MHPPSALTLVALLNDEVVGYLNVHHVFDEGDLNLLAVQAEYRRKGIAARLVKELKFRPSVWEFAVIHWKSGRQCFGYCLLHSAGALSRLDEGKTITSSR